MLKRKGIAPDHRAWLDAGNDLPDPSPRRRRRNGRQQLVCAREPYGDLGERSNLALALLKGVSERTRLFCFGSVVRCIPGSRESGVERIGAYTSRCVDVNLLVRVLDPGKNSRAI